MNHYQGRDGAYRLEEGAVTFDGSNFKKFGTASGMLGRKEDRGAYEGGSNEPIYSKMNFSEILARTPYVSHIAWNDSFRGGACLGCRPVKGLRRRGLKRGGGEMLDVRRKVEFY